MSSFVRNEMITLSPSNAARSGNSSLRFVKRQVSGNFGTHSLHKTWAYHAHLSEVDLALIMHKLNHESIAYTKRYLGITDDELHTVAQRLNL